MSKGKTKNDKKVLIYDETKNPSMKLEPKKCPHMRNPNGTCMLTTEPCERVDANEFENFETCYNFECRDLFERGRIVAVKTALGRSV